VAEPRVIVGLADRPSRGIVLTVLGAGFIVCNDAAMKWVVADHPVGQAVFVRSLFVVCGLLALAVLRPSMAQALRWRNVGLQLVCAALLVLSIFAFMSSLTRLPLSLAILIFFVNPLFITVLAPLVSDEKVGWRRRVAVLVGFAGAAIIIRPTGSGFDWILLGPVAAAFFSALRDLCVRRTLQGETSVSVLFYSTLVVAAASSMTAVAGWPALSLVDLVVLALAAAGFGLGVFFATDALRFADASLLATYKYTSILWALAIGFILWQEVPAPAVWLGAVLIVSSGVYIIARQRKLRDEEWIH